MTHRYEVGQKIRMIESTRYMASSASVYEVVRQLPESEGEMSYRIKSLNETNERVVRESQIEKA